MEDYKITVDVDPEDKYIKAKKDLLEAMDSFQQLTPQERERLITELLGVAAVNEVCRIMNQSTRR